MTAIDLGSKSLSRLRVLMCHPHVRISSATPPSYCLRDWEAPSGAPPATNLEWPASDRAVAPRPKSIRDSVHPRLPAAASAAAIATKGAGRLSAAPPLSGAFVLSPLLAYRAPSLR